MRPFVDGYAAGLTPNPCMRCNGAFRFELWSTSRERAGASRALDRPLRACRRAGRAAARRARRRSPPRTSPTCSRPSTRRCSTASGSRSAATTKAETRAEAARPGSPPRAGPRARRRASSPAATTAAFLARQGLERRARARSSTRRARRSADTMASGVSHPGQRRGLGVAAARAALRAPHRRRDEHPRRRAARRARVRRRRRPRGPLRSGRRGSRRSFATARRRSPATVERAPRTASRSSSTSRSRRRPGPGRGALRRRRGRRGGRDHRARQRGRIPRDATARLHRRRRRLLGPRDLPRRCSGSARCSRSSSSARLFDASRPRSSGAPSATLLPVIVKTGGTVDRVNYQLDKPTRSPTAPSRWPTAPTRPCARSSTAISKPVEKVSGLAAGVAHGFSSLRKTPELSATRWARPRTPRGGARPTSPRISGTPADAARASVRRRRRLRRPRRSRIPGRGRSRRRSRRPGPATSSRRRQLWRATRRRRPSSRRTRRRRTGVTRAASVIARTSEPAHARWVVVASSHASGPPDARRYDRGMRTTAELREGFLSFFESNGPPALPVVAADPAARRPSTLFISAGMQPLKPYFSGAKQPPAPRFTTVQKCLRAGGKDTDLDEVGLDRAARLDVRDARQLLVRRLLQGRRRRLRLGVRHRAHAARARAALGDGLRGRSRCSASARTRSRSRPGSGWACRASGSSPFPRSDNFWGPAGETGPVRPVLGAPLRPRRGATAAAQADCGPNCERCDRYIEFWNLVFMEFDLAADGSLTPLPKQNIDTGPRPRARRDAPPGRRVDLRHRRLPADHGLDRRGVGRRATATRPRRRRRTACSPTTAAA